jgi:hypothetical protein
VLKSNWQLQYWSLSQRNDRPSAFISLRKGAPLGVKAEKHLFASDNMKFILCITPSRSSIAVVSVLSFHVVSVIDMGQCMIHGHNPKLAEYLLPKMADDLKKEIETSKKED